MQQVRKIITQIRATLDEGSQTPRESLAAEYARFREDAARRLESCEGMLAKGSEHSALELAEAPPPLLELVAELSFAEEPLWRSMCTAHGLPTGPVFDSRTVAALEAVYAKGLSPNSPLYQSYRAAVTGRDDAKALHIIRTIARVNPSDANAQAELDRLRNKFMHLKLDALRAALAADQDQAVADLVDELGDLAVREKLEAQPDYQRGVAVRTRVRLAEAARDLPAILEELERLQRAGDWQEAGERLSVIEEQERELGLTFDPAQVARRDAVRQFFEERRADAAEQARFLQAVERLRACGEQSATRVAGASTLTLDEAQAVEARFDQLDHEVKQFRRTIPEPAASSIHAARTAVHGASARIRRGKAMRRAAAVLVVVAIVGGTLAWFGRAALVKSCREKLEDFQKNGRTLAAQELLQSIERRNILGIHAAADLQAARADTGRWVADQEELRNQAQAQIAAIEQEDFAKADPAELYGKLNAVTKLTGALASDLMPPLRERIAVVQRRMEAHFAKLREASGATWRATFAEAQALLAPMSFEKPSIEVMSVVAKTTPMLRTLEKDVSHPVPALRPDADLVEAYQALAKKEEEFRGEILALNTARAALEKAETQEEYGAALKAYAAVRFSEALLAQPALKEFPTADDPAADLLMEGDRDAWNVVKADKAFGAALRPQDVRPEEVGLLLALRDDPDLQDVWQWTLVSGGSVKKAYSRGMLREYVVGGEKRYTGRIWEPQEKDRTPIFIETKLAKSGGPVNFSSFMLSPASQMLAGLKLQELTNAGGTQWTRPAFEVIRDLVRFPIGSPTARAILMQRLGALTSLRPYEWSMHCCPSLRRDLAELDALCEGRRLNTFEWMLPSTVTKLDAKLSEFFDRISTRDYSNEARRFRDAALSVRDAGVRYAGFVDGEGRAHVIQSARAASELWCLGAGPPVLLRVTPAGPNAGLGTQTSGCRPFSPLFHVPLDRAALLQRTKLSDPSIPFLSPP